MVDLRKLSDEALWRLLADGAVEAEDELTSRYVRLVKVCTRPYFLVGGDSEDLIQEGMLGLLSAVRTYDYENDAAFSTYAERCIRNRVLSAIKSASRFKHIPLNDYVSIESPQFDERQTTRSFEFSRDPEELLITRERVDEITRGMRVSLSGFESEVLGLYLDGMSYFEISEKLNKTPKSVDNAVQRIRKKLSQYL